MQKIAVIMAHPDDAEIWAGGSLINHRDRGDEILIICLFKHGAHRRDEAFKSAKEMNAKIKLLNGDADAAELFLLLSDFEPSIIITHWEKDTHDDHVKVFRMVWQVIPKLVVERKIKFNLFSCDCHNSIGRSICDIFSPTDYVDITSVWEQKKEIIAIHETQNTEHWIGMIEYQNMLHGARVGVAYAEGFIQIPVLGVSSRSKRYLTGAYE